MVHIIAGLSITISIFVPYNKKSSYMVQLCIFQPQSSSVSVPYKQKPEYMVQSPPYYLDFVSEYSFPIPLNKLFHIFGNIYSFPKKHKKERLHQCSHSICNLSFYFSIRFLIKFPILQTLPCNQPGTQQFPDLLMDVLSSVQLPCKVLLQYLLLPMHSL